MTAVSRSHYKTVTYRSSTRGQKTFKHLLFCSFTLI